MATIDDSGAAYFGSDFSMDLNHQPDGSISRVRIRYSITHRGVDQSLVVFNAGSTRDPKLPSRRFRIDQAGDLTVIEALQPSPDPEPPAPLVAIGRQLKPSERHQQTVDLRIATGYPLQTGNGSVIGPRRIRFCVGVALLDSDQFRQLDTDSPLWIPSPQVSEQQSYACSEWVELKRD